MMRGKDVKPYSIADFMPADQQVVDPFEQTWDNFRQLAKASEHGKH